MSICPNCGKKSLEPILRSRPYMIIKESVTGNEMEQSTLFTLSGVNKYGNNENTTSYYLAKELGMAGLSMQTLSLSALWLHTPPKASKGKEGKEEFQKCMDFSMAEVIRACEGKKVVMLMGAEIVRTFTGYGVSDVSGLVCKSDFLPDVPVIVPAPNPDKMMAVPIGELRNAIRVFAEQVKIHEAYMKV